MKRNIYTVLCGADRLDEASELLKGRRCGLMTSASGVDKRGVPTYVKLAEHYDLTVLFAPEHGIHSVHQAGGWGGTQIDAETGCPVYDIGGGKNPEIDKALSLCDIVVYDIADVGARFYTYIYSLTHIMTECAARNIPVLVLDRPDPISGSLDAIAGAVLDESRFSSFIGKYALPVRYSMTVGEFARYINDKKNIGCELHVLRVSGWERAAYADMTDLPWYNPSPNIPTVDCAVNYIGTCIFEATNISEGRGTTRPFDIVGAPFIDSRKLAEHMNSRGLDGVFFSRAYFTPTFSKHAGEICEGVQINITDRALYSPHKCGLHLLAAMREYSEFTWNEWGICERYGNDTLTAHGGFDVDEVVRGETEDIERFKNDIRAYLMYQ